MSGLTDNQKRELDRRLSRIAEEENAVSSNVDVLHETDWVVALGPTGTGKTTIMTYYLHWFLYNCDWIEAIYSTTPFFAGNIFDDTIYPHNIYPEEDETGGKAYLEFGLPEGEWPAIRVDDPDVFSPQRPFVGDDGNIYYRPKLHPKLRKLVALRTIDKIRNCVFFGDELGNLLPARNYKDQRQWLITKMAKDFRRHNVVFLATDQYNKAFDIQLRENFSQIVRPLNFSAFDYIRWEYYLCKDDPDFTNYKMHMGYLIYPDEASIEDGFWRVPRSTVYRFFDSKHAVPIAFNEPMDDDKLRYEASEFMRFLLETNYFRILGKLWKNNEPVDPGFNVFDRCIKAWNHQWQKYYNEAELNSILGVFQRDCLDSIWEKTRPVTPERVRPYHFECTECPRKILSEYIMRAHCLSKHGEVNKYRKVED